MSDSAQSEIRKHDEKSHDSLESMVRSFLAPVDYKFKVENECTRIMCNLNMEEKEIEWQRMICMVSKTNEFGKLIIKQNEEQKKELDERLKKKRVCNFHVFIGIS